jgi:Fe-S cluster biosynthesis and repair protein YggX
MVSEGLMAITCTRCGQAGDPPPAHRVAFLGSAQKQVLEGICSNCWKEWEGMEVKVINEYRLNFMDPEHREAIKRACTQFLGLPQEA